MAFLGRFGWFFTFTELRFVRYIFMTIIVIFESCFPQELFNGTDRKKASLLHHRSFLGFQDVVRQDPGHGHFNGELDPAAHSQLQEKLPEPELGEVTTLLQCFYMEETARKQVYKSHLTAV